MRTHSTRGIGPGGNDACTGDHELQQRKRFIGRLSLVVAVEFLQQRFLKSFLVGRLVRCRFGWRHARRLRLVRARFLERQLMREGGG